jgi:hypothetical protein
MSFTGNEDQEITLTEASALTANYRAASTTNTVLGHYFGKTIINNILAQEACVGIRVYYALTTTGQKQLVLVGVDEDENDLCDGVLGDRSFLCPPICGNANALNSDVS